MTEFIQVVTALREQMQATLSRSDVLKPLAWLVGLLLATLVLLAWAKASETILTIILVLIVGSVVLYVAAYGFCLFADRDALRSERYSIQKMAIEHGLIGDSKSGLFEEHEIAKPAGDTSAKQIEHKQ